MAGALTVVFPHATSSGGVERVTLEVLRHRAARGTGPVRFVGVEPSGVAGVEERPVRIGSMPGALRPAAFRRAAGAALRGLGGTVLTMGVECPPGDVLWVHSVHAAWLDRGGDLVLRGRRIPASARRLLPVHRVLLALEKRYFTASRPRALICTSEREVADLQRYYGVDPALATVIPNGYDEAVFTAPRRVAGRDAARRRIGAAPDDVVVLLVANEWHRKGLGVLLRAVAALDDPRVRIDLVGAREPVDHWPLAERLGVRGRVHWHGATDRVLGAYAAADVAVLPSSYEPFGIVAIEAMACGLPVIVSATSGAATAVDDGVNGLLLADPHDGGELTAHLRTLLAAQVRSRLGAAAAASVGEYSWSRILTRVDTVLDGTG